MDKYLIITMIGGFLLGASQVNIIRGVLATIGVCLIAYGLNKNES